MWNTLNEYSTLLAVFSQTNDCRLPVAMHKRTSFYVQVYIN